MPAAVLQGDRVPLKPIIEHVETSNYNQRATELLDDWTLRQKQSTFLRVKYGLIDAKTKLDQIFKLRSNWDSYGAEPATVDAINASKQILAALAQKLILPTTIVPSAGGGISTYFMAGDRTVYVETYNDGSQALVMYDQSGNTEVLEIGCDIPPSEVGGRLLAYIGE